MGIVRFSTVGEEVRAGFRVDDGITDLRTGYAEFVNGDPSRTESYLGRIDELEEEILSNRPEDTIPLDDVTFHAPTIPRRLICLEGCYEQDLVDSGIDSHFDEAGMFNKEWPSLWCAPESAYVGPSTEVRLPSSISVLVPGLELGLLINGGGKNLDRTDASSSIAGYVIFAHLVSHDQVPRLEGHRMFDSAFQMGAEVVPRSSRDIGSLSLALSIDGILVDKRTTSDWRFTPEEMVSEASHVMSLTDGDVILTGDPTRVDRSVSDGDTLAASSPGILGTGNQLVRDRGEA